MDEQFSVPTGIPAHPLRPAMNLALSSVRGADSFSSSLLNSELRSGKGSRSHKGDPAPHASPEAASISDRQRQIQARLRWLLRSERERLGEPPYTPIALDRWRIACTERFGAEIRELLIEQQTLAIQQQTQAILQRTRVRARRLPLGSDDSSDEDDETEEEEEEATSSAIRRSNITLSSRALPGDPLGGEKTFRTLSEQTLRRILQTLGVVGLSQKAPGGGSSSSLVVLAPEDFSLLEDGGTYHLVGWGR